MNNTTFFLAAFMMVMWVGPGFAKEPIPKATSPVPRIVTLEGKNFNRKDAEGEVVTVGDDGWETAPHFYQKEKEPFSGVLLIPFFKNGTNNVQAIFNYDKGKQHGLSTIWDRNGTKRVEEDFSESRIVKGSYWLADGKPDPQGNKGSKLAASTKLMAKLGVQALAARGGFGLPPEKDPENIRFDNWIRYQANSDQKRRHQECVNVLTAQYLKTRVGQNEAIYRAYCWIRAPQQRHRFITYIVSGIDPQGQGAGLAPEIITSYSTPQLKRPPLPNGLRSSGSGFFITNDGYLITNHHVAGKAKYLTVRGHLATGGRELPAKVVALDKRNDLALLKVTGRFNALPIISSRSLVLGDDIFAIGYPHISLQGVHPKLTKGSISSLAGLRDKPTHFQVSVPIQPGNSGGPQMNELGNVIGVSVSRLEQVPGSKRPVQLVNFAIKSDVLVSFLRRTKIRLTPSAPHFATPGGFRDVVRRTEPACVIVLVY